MPSLRGLDWLIGKEVVPANNYHGARKTEEYRVREVKSGKVLIKMTTISDVKGSRRVRKETWLSHTAC